MIFHIAWQRQVHALDPTKNPQKTLQGGTPSERATHGVPFVSILEKCCRYIKCSNVCLLHYQLITWWRNQIEIFSMLLAHRSPVNSPHKGQWRRALVFSLICAWTNGWANNGDASNLRRHCAPYDVHVMIGRLQAIYSSQICVVPDNIIFPRRRVIT